MIRQPFTPQFYPVLVVPFEKCLYQKENNKNLRWYVHDLSRVQNPVRIERLLYGFHYMDCINAHFHQQRFLLANSNPMFSLFKHLKSIRWTGEASTHSASAFHFQSPCNHAFYTPLNLLPLSIDSAIIKNTAHKISVRLS